MNEHLEEGAGTPEEACFCSCGDADTIFGDVYAVAFLTQVIGHVGGEDDVCFFVVLFARFEEGYFFPGGGFKFSGKVASHGAFRCGEDDFAAEGVFAVVSLPAEDVGDDAGFGVSVVLGDGFAFNGDGVVFADSFLAVFGKGEAYLYGNVCGQGGYFAFGGDDLFVVCAKEGDFCSGDGGDVEF